MDDPIVKIESIIKKFKTSENNAINNISINIYPGKITGLIGPDGSGKTTLIRLINGLLKPDSGFIKIKEIDNLKNINEYIGYMPQKFGLYEDLKVNENLDLYANLKNVVGKDRKEQFEKLIHFSNLEKFQKRFVKDLSGGMKQKLGLACALIGNPKLLLLDEPTVGVDPISRRELWKMVTDLLKTGIGILWSTSYLDEAEKCDNVIFLNEGKKLYDGIPLDFLKNVNDKVFTTSTIESYNKRKILKEIINQENIIDSYIQGDNIRILINDTNQKNLKNILEKNNLTLNTSNPKFEDAYIYILGDRIKNYSKLSETIKQKEKIKKPIINVKNLTKKFGDFTAVDKYNFKINRGEIFGLLGPNGSGKSTIFKMLSGILKPTSGEAIVGEFDLKKSSSQARGRIGYMAQNFSLYKQLTPLQNMDFYSTLYGLRGKEQKEKIDLMIDMFDLKKHLTRNSEELPQGFKQRLSLACSIMHEPDVLFLDEPTSGVSPIMRREFWNHINSMVEKGITIMVTTHFMEEAEYCDRIGLIYKGKNIATGTPDELKKQVPSLNPTLEDAFINLIKTNELNNKKSEDII